MNRFVKIVLLLFLVSLFLTEYLHPTKELYVDLGEHLLRGQLLLQTHQVPTTNIFSYTYPNFHYIDLEWVTEAVFYITTVAFGINGLIILAAVSTLVSFLCIYLFAMKRTNVWLASYVAVFYFLVLYECANVLPEIFSYLFLSIFIVALYKFREKYTNLIWLLIPLQLLWVNMHIYFIIGILLIWLFLLEAVIQFRKKDNGKYVQNLFILFVATVLVSIINPYRVAGLVY